VNEVMGVAARTATNTRERDERSFIVLGDDVEASKLELEQKITEGVECEAALLKLTAFAESYIEAKRTY